MVDPNILHNIDADLHHYNELYPEINSGTGSDYFTFDKFNNDFSSNYNNFSLIHLNIRSLYPKVDEFQAELNNLNYKFDVLCLTETWLNHSISNLVQIDGYTDFHVMREHGRGGGVCIYVLNKFNCKLLERFCFCEEFLECCFVEVTCDSIRFLIGVIYRPPDGNKD